MIIFKILANLYTNKDAKWILEIEDKYIQPYVIQRWIAMDDNVRVYARWLDKYTFNVPPKMYLSLAWSIIPKVQKAPFIKYIKKDDTKGEFDGMIKKFQDKFKVSDNDMKENLDIINMHIDENKKLWFDFFDMPKAYYKKYFIEDKR